MVSTQPRSMQDLSRQKDLSIVTAGKPAEYGISLTKMERDLEPSKLSNLIFSRVIGSDLHKATHASIANRD